MIDERPADRVNPAMAELIHAALVMDTSDMTAEPHLRPG